ncbi:hydroxymethylglutaryl-CoA lyase [Rhodothermaceae bacterium RA]|nr:hydroxymethylglutaryl-CoA lyase [Rhodothermaceae bacterium RA]
MAYPPRVELCEVGPRDGFQFEQKPIPTELKRAVIEQLVAAGVSRIQVTSFVHPKWVPQMADAEALVARLPERPGVVYSGLVLNPRGLERALRTRLSHVDLSIATNEQHSRDNANMTVDEGLEAAVAMVQTARRHGVAVQLGLQTVFGYAAPGDTPLDRVLAMAGRFRDLGIESLSLADSTGLANPVMIRERVQAVQAVMGDVPIVLHLHDTRGLGLANVVAALEVGVSRFDTSLGGLGGCPFIPGATGNIATEDTVYLLDQLGIETGIDLAGVAAVSRRMAAFLGRELPGKLYRLVTNEAAS